MLGLVALYDPPRTDSAALLGELRALGVHTIMVTGDTAATAVTIGRAIGIEGNICPSGQIPDRVTAEDVAIYAGVFPEEKFRLVKALQRSGHAVGMCGDGANDAPALRQAQFYRHLGSGRIQTLIFLTFVFVGQSLVYVLRERGHMWNSRLSLLMMTFSLVDIAVVSTLAVSGTLMRPLPVGVIGALLGATVIFALLLDQVKVALFRHLPVD